MPQDFSKKSMVRLPDGLHPFHGLGSTISLLEKTTVETERRKFRRLLPQELTFAALRPHFNRLGKVKDISKGGLAFEYILSETQYVDSSEIDVFVSSDRFYLRRIPSKIVYDIKMVEEYQSLERRWCGVQFGDLTEEQADKLDSFLQNHTTGTV